MLKPPHTDSLATPLKIPLATCIAFRIRNPVAAFYALLTMLAIFAGCTDPNATQPNPSQPNSTQARDPMTFNYPSAPRSDQVDDYHGTQVADPFRPLEELKSEQTQAWVAAQNKLTRSFLDDIPQRKWIESRLTKLWDYERYGLPRSRQGKYFYTYNNGLQNQSVLRTADSLQDEGRLLLDPNKLADDGTVAMAGWRPSDDGRFMAYGLAEGGSDWRVWKVLDVVEDRELLDRVDWVKFSSVAWDRKQEGFFYSRYDEPDEGEAHTGQNYFQKLYYHRLGTAQFKDRLVYERKDEKEWGFGGYVTEDGRYLIIEVWKGSLPKNQVFYLDLEAENAEVVELIKGFDAEYDFIGNDGAKFWIVTDDGAPKKRVMAVDLAQPERENWIEVIPESEQTLRGVGVVGNQFFANYLQDAATQIKRFDLTGKPLGEVPLPGLCSAGGFGGRRDDNETFYTYTSFTSPGTIYRYDIASGESTVYRQPQVDIDPDQYETKQVFYTSADGTQVPMFISHKKGIELDGNNPTILYGYGGFDISLTPSFSVSMAVWMEMGGVYAMANLRGGGEYGTQWHEAGMKHNKQKVFDDFIAAAGWLKENKYTRTEKLAIMGGSNGGLLVGAVMTQEPDLCAATLPAVGVMDMLRYHKFTIGWAWQQEFGSSDNAEEFATLYKYSPLHNLKPDTAYPATLITTADTDDRVVPGHSYKFAAALQEAHTGHAPVLIRVETSAGHGAGTPTTKRIAEAADKLAFLAKILDVATP